MSQGETIRTQLQEEVSRSLLSGEPVPGQIRDIVAACLKLEFKKPGASSKEIISGACHGAMCGVVLASKDAAAGAVEVLQAIANIVQERSGDPMRTLGYALEGIARIASTVSPAEVGRIGMAIDSQYMGAGSTFNDFVAQQAPRS